MHLLGFRCGRPAVCTTASSGLQAGVGQDRIGQIVHAGSDQYAPFSSKVVNVGVRDSTYVLDGAAAS